MTIRLTPALFALALASSFSACSVDDGVPAVSDPRAIVVDGKPMTQSEFISKYCRDKAANKTCQLVRDAKVHDDANRPMPKGW